MKRLIGIILLILLMLLVVLGCDNEDVPNVHLDEEAVAEIVEDGIVSTQFYVITIREHKYLYCDTIGGITHSGDCPCWERRTKEMENRIIEKVISLAIEIDLNREKIE